MKTYQNCQKKDKELFFKFSMAVAYMDPNYKKNSVLAIEVEPVTTTDPKFWKWSGRQLDAILGTIPTRSPVTNRDGTAQIDQSF